MHHSYKLGPWLPLWIFIYFALDHLWKVCDVYFINRLNCRHALHKFESTKKSLSIDTFFSLLGLWCYCWDYNFQNFSFLINNGNFFFLSFKHIVHWVDICVVYETIPLNNGYILKKTKLSNTAVICLILSKALEFGEPLSLPKPELFCFCYSSCPWCSSLAVFAIVSYLYFSWIKNKLYMKDNDQYFF